MSKALFKFALLLALLMCAAGARAQRVGPVDDDAGASGGGAKPAAEKSKESKPDAKAKRPDAAATTDAKPAAKSETKAETKAAAVEQKRDHTSPPAVTNASASGESRPANNPISQASAPPAGGSPAAGSPAAATNASASKPTATDNSSSATPLGEKAASPVSSSSAVPAASPAAHDPAPDATPTLLGGGATVGSLPAPPKYEPPQPLKADAPASNGASSNVASAAASSASSSALSPTSIYRVGAGDILDIRLVGGMSKDYTLFTVLSNGTIDYPLAGEPVSVLNLTPEEIGSRLSAALKRRGIFDRAQFQIAVRDYTSHTVLVSGLVDQPGQKVLRREAVPLYVVLAEAFPRADAGRVVIISRGSGSTKTLDLSDSGAQNELVSSGDVINVQPRPQEFYYIAGAVGAPGQKDYHAGLTLTQAILAAGGLTHEAGKKVVVVVSRQGADGRLVPAEYALSEIQDGKTPDPRVQPGDRIEVGRRR